MNFLKSLNTSAHMGHHIILQKNWKWLRYLCRFWLVKIYFELTFQKIESKMKLLRGQEFFITSFIVTATAVMSVSLTKYDSVWRCWWHTLETICDDDKVEKLVTDFFTWGDSDVGDIVMLVTLWWWPTWDVVGRIIVGDFFRYVGDFFNVFNRSPTSQNCHHHS